VKGVQPPPPVYTGTTRRNEDLSGLPEGNEAPPSYTEVVASEEGRARV
jgi:hypothetical protein